MTKLKRLAIITLFAILATACGTQQPIKGGGSSSSSSKASTASINDLLAQAQLAPALQAAQLKLQAAKLMLSKNQFAKTVTLIDSIDATKLTANLNFKIALAKAAALIGLQDGNSAINLLSSLPDDIAENNQQKLQKHQLLANAYGLTNQLTKETLSLIAASEFSYQATDLLAINEKIWQLFKTIDLSRTKTAKRANR